MLQNETTVIIKDTPVLTIEVSKIGDIVLFVNMNDMIPGSSDTDGEYGSGTYGSGTYG